jgi:hypothetical protein
MGAGGEEAMMNARLAGCAGVIKEELRAEASG